MIILSRLLVVVFLFLVACNKQDLDKDLDNPSIELIYPKDNPDLWASQPLCVKMIVTENIGLSSLTWEIINSKTGKREKSMELYPSFTRLFVVEEKLTLTELSGEYIYKLTASDREGNTSKLTIPFSVNN